MPAQVTGGGATFSVRAAYAPACEKMPFTAKLIIVFNENNMPRLDVEDEAFMRRLLLVEHRSLFCKTQDAYDKRRTEPYTFLANKDLKEQLSSAAVLAWMLEGLAQYREQGASHMSACRSSALSAIPAHRRQSTQCPCCSPGFAVLPTQLEEWKRALVMECDDVRAWLHDNVVEGTPNDQLTAREVRVALLDAGVVRTMSLKKVQDKLLSVYPERARRIAGSVVCKGVYLG